MTPDQKKITTAIIALTFAVGSATDAVAQMGTRHAARAGGAARPSANASRGANLNRGGSLNNNTNINRNVNYNRNGNVNRNVNVNRNYTRNANWNHGGTAWHNGYWHNGVWRAGYWGAAAVGAAAAVTAAAIGSTVYALPSGCGTVVVGGASYYQCGSAWYQPQYIGGSTQYVVVNPPQ